MKVRIMDRLLDEGHETTVVEEALSRSGEGIQLNRPALTDKSEFRSRGMRIFTEVWIL